jgi:hypothetical protein
LQAVFNELAWKPSYDNYKSTDVTIRIMNIYDFVNSKTLFRTMRWVQTLDGQGSAPGNPTALLLTHFLEVVPEQMGSCQHRSFGDRFSSTCTTKAMHVTGGPRGRGGGR